MSYYDPKTVIAIALDEVGYLEKESNAELDDPTANAGDKNYTKYARDLDAISFYNGRKQGVMWCDVFVDWCFVQAFGKDVTLAITFQPTKGNCGAGCKYSRGYYKNAGRLFDEPEVGDQIFFGNSDSITHTGLVYNIIGDTIYTVEGNADNGVNRYKYTKGSSRIKGFGRPNWGEPEETQEDEPEEETSEERICTIVSPGGKVNLRYGDSKSYAVVGQVKDGSTHPYVASSDNGWYAVRYKKYIAWVSSEFAEVGYATST